MHYRQLTPGERYMLAALRRQGYNQAEIARSLGRHRSTVCREVKRRRKRYGAYDSRSRLAGKRMIGERPPGVEARARRPF